MSPLIDPIDPNNPEEPGDPIKGKEIECPGKIRFELKVAGPNFGVQNEAGAPPSNSKMTTQFGPYTLTKSKNKS